MGFAWAASAQTAHFSGAIRTLGSSFSSPFGVAVDGSGNVFVADAGNNAVKEIVAVGGSIPTSPTINTLGNGFSSPYGVAVDGSGNVFVADTFNNAVKEILAAGGYTTVNTLGSGFSEPFGVAVDGSGNVFVADFNNNAVKEIVAAGGYTTVNTVGSGFYHPGGVAVDGSGNVFVADSYNNAVKEILAAGGYTTVNILGSGFSDPFGVAVDGSGNVFVADYGHHAVKEILAAGGYTTVDTLGTGFADPFGVAVDGSGNVFVGDYGNSAAKEILAVSNFGPVNVGSASSISIPLYFTFDTGGTLGSTAVLTQGAAGLDFTDAGTGTCTAGAAYNAGDICTVVVTFKPSAPGPRYGAAELLGESGNLLVTTLIHGTGQGPAMAFGPGVQTAVPASGLFYPSGVAMDGAGDIFIADSDNSRVVEVPAGGGPQTTVGSGLLYPSGVAVDGAGDVFIADYDNRVVEVPAGGGSQTTVNVTVGGSGLSGPSAVAVDGVGDVFIADSNNNRVVEVPAGGGAQTTVGSGLLYPDGVAVDGVGDVFVADQRNNRVVEVPAGGGPQTTVASGLNYPEGVAVDGAGDVFIADSNNNRVVEVPAGGGPQTTVGSGLLYPSGVAVDGAGDVFIADTNNGRVVEVQRSLPPAFSFATTAVGSTSTDSPQSVTVQNIGNQLLNAVAPGLSIGSNSFVQVAGSGTPADCNGSFSLAPGASCNLSLNFTPQTIGSIVSAATFTDNALNTSAASQSITLQGTGTGYVLTTAASPSNGGTVAPASGSYYAPGAVVGLTATPDAGYVFSGWTGSADVANSSSASTTVTMNAAESVTANFLPITVQVTVGTSPPGPSFSVDGIAYSSAQTMTWTVGSSHTLATTSPQTPVTGTQDTIASWSDSGAISHMVVAPSVSTTYTATFNTSYLLTTSASPSSGGEVYPVSGSYFATGTEVGLTATPNAGYSFSGWTGSPDVVNPSSAETSVTMNAAETVTANFQLVQSISFTSAQTILPTSGLNNPEGVAVDKAGDVFISDPANYRVVEVPAGGVPQTTVEGQYYPQGVAVDGAGDVFIVDASNSTVVEIPAGGGPQTTVGSGLNSPTGLAVDGAGDVFIADAHYNHVVEVPAGGGAQVTLNVTVGGIGLNDPEGLAVDGAGDVFIADTGNNRVVEVPAVGGAQTTVGSGLNYPTNVAVDGAGNVFIADANNTRVVEVPAVGGAQTTVGSGLYNPYGVAVDGAGDVFIADTGNNRVVEVQRLAVNFGSVNISSRGTAALNYTVNADTTFGASPLVLTQGAPNLDFTLSGTTCTGTITAGNSCTVNVQFAPLAPGLRMGAVQLADSSGNLLVTTFLHGIGQGPAIAFGPGSQNTVGSGLRGPSGVAVDGAGDVFVADYGNNRVVEVPAGGGSQTTVGSGLYGPAGVAVDGAGDVFIADDSNSRVVEVPARGGAQTTVGSGLHFPASVAADGAGDVFIADFGNSRVVEVPASGGAQITVATGLASPLGVAVDGVGDVFIADSGNNRVVEVPAGGSSQTTVGSGLSYPDGVAVDGLGNVFIADTGNSRIVEVPAGGGSQTAVGSGLSDPSGAAVDGAGDVFIADTNNGRVVEVQRSLPPAFSFATTAVGSTSTDSPQSVTVQNIGNQLLNAVAPGLSIGSNSFVQVAGSGTPADCNGSFSLAPGASCNLSLNFTPQTIGSIVSAATFTDNALNTSAASQSITLQGTGTQPNQTITFPAPPPSAAYDTTFPVIATSTSGLLVTINASGACSISGGVVTMTASSGTCTLTASQLGNTDYSAAPNVVNTVTATLAGQTITFPAPPSSATYNTTFPVSATSTSGLSPTINASGSCSISDGTVTMTNGIGTCTLTASQPGNTDYSAAPNVVNTVTAALAGQTITFPAPPPSAAYNTTFPVSATSTSGLSPTINASGSCSISGGAVTMTASSGTCTLTASQPGNTDYSAAANVVHTVTATLANQAITFTGAPASAAYGSSFAVAASASSGLTVTITSSGACSISGVTVTMTASSGICTLTASQPGNSNYNAATSVVQSTTATKATPTINWGTPAPIVYGTTLTSTQLNATATYNGSSVAGTFVYTPAKGVVLGAGRNTLSVTFTPTNTTRYTTATGTVALQVNQATPKITWAKPAAITYGTAISGTQLDATVSVAGSFAYSPSVGTVLSAGTQTLSVTFTPTNTTDYTSATDTVTLTVNTASSTTTITSQTPNPSLVNQAVTVSFQVTGSGVGPTGNVTVTASTGQTCSGGLSAGAGSCSLTFTTAGSPKLTAKYAGDSNFKSSSSAKSTQTVQP